MTYNELFLQECKRRLLDESFHRITTCIQLLSEEQLWFKPSKVCNSVGNLTLHVCGNVRQWLFSGLLGFPDIRKRSREFSTLFLPSAKIIENLTTLSQDIHNHWQDFLNTDLNQIRPVQTFKENGWAIWIHVVEHASYHTGQITYITKWLTGKETNYYQNIPLE